MKCSDHFGREPLNKNIQFKKHIPGIHRKKQNPNKIGLLDFI